MLALRMAALVFLAVLLDGMQAWAATVAVRFRQPADCDAIARWELLAAPVAPDQPEPMPWDATVAGVIPVTGASGRCGAEQRATVEVEGRGATRFWLRVVATTGVALSEGFDAVLPRDDVPLRTVGGGGDPTRDCLAVFRAPANHPPARPRGVRCVDGDPECDADGTADGACTIPVGVCANSTFASRICVSPAVETVVVRGAVQGRGWTGTVAAQLQGAIDVEIRPPSTRADACIAPRLVRVPLVHWGRRGVCRPGRRCLVVIAAAPPGAGGRWRDRDELRLVCVPGASPASCRAVTGG